jgi:predicted O-methyltransferase YrrM
VAFAKEYFKKKPITVAEIGSFRGENAESILRTLNVEKIFLIDPYEEYDKYREDGYYYLVKKAENKAKKRIGSFRKKVNFIKKFSKDAVKNIPKCDFIYIDGNHDYEYVLEDLNLYSKKLNEKGILAGHDIQMEGVVNAVLKFLEKNKKYQLHIESPDWWLTEKDDK